MTSVQHQWPPRRAGCSGDCWQGRAPCDCALIQREGLSAIDTLLQRADCDPALPIGQDEDSDPGKPSRSAEMLGGLLLALVIVASIAAAVLLAHWAAGDDEPVNVPVVSTRGMV